jgi:flagellar hook-associated protein 3 FlgL
MNRVTFTQINDTVLRNISRNYKNLSSWQEKLSSGKRLNRPSDNPIDMKNNISYKAEMSQTAQYKRNIEDGQGWISMTEVAMNNMNEIMQRMRELGIQASNDTLIGQEREYIAQEVDQLVRQLMSLSNSTYKGDYIFGGTNADKMIYNYKTGENYSFTPGQFAAGVDNAMTVYGNNTMNQYKRIDPKTLSLSYDAGLGSVAAVEGTDFTVDYANGTLRAVAGSAFETAVLGGPVTVNVTFNHYDKVNKDNGGSILREIEQGVKPRINVSADELFDDTANNVNMFGVSVKMLDGLRSNNGEKIGNAIRDMDLVFAKIRATQSSNGARFNRFDLTLVRNESRQIELSRMQSKLEDLDFAEAITEFSLSENVFNASLKAGAKVIMPSLGNYI